MRSDEYVLNLNHMVYTGAITSYQYHYRLGIYHGYPECCIKNYLNLMALDIAPAGFMHFVLRHDHHDIHHVMCPMCYDKYDKENPNRPRENAVYIDPNTRKPATREKYYSVYV